MKRPNCERCTAMEARNARRGYYLRECCKPSDERAYGPFCSPQCVWRAVAYGAIRTRCYTRSFTKAKDAPTFYPRALPPSQAPVTQRPEWKHW